MTLEEALAKIKELEVSSGVKDVALTTANGKITKLNDENAERRVLNNQQKKNLHVAKSVINKNNIKVDFDKIGTDNLTLNKETGQVEGEVSYNPASNIEVGGGVPPVSNPAPQAMTIETIQGMSRDAIAKNWDAISEVLTGVSDNQTT